MTKPLKVEIDRPTLACLMTAFNELDPSLFMDDDAPDYQGAAVYHMLVEIIEDMATKPFDMQYKLKLNTSKVFAFRFLASRTIATDSWTAAMLIDLLDALDRYILNNVTYSFFRPQLLNGTNIKLN